VATEVSNSLFDFIFKSKITSSQKGYSEVKQSSVSLVIVPVKIMALLVAIFGLLAMIFEIKYFAEYSVQIYIIRLSSTLIAFSVLTLLSTQFAEKYSIFLVHLLLLTIITSSGLLIYHLPTTLLVNSSIIGLMVFTSALFLSWEVKHQIVVAIYYNALFAGAILLNDKAVYFLPNMFESVMFVLVLSVVSIIACAVNFKMRLMLAEKNISVEISEKKFKSIFHNSAEGIFQSTLDGKWLTLNKTCADILGYDSTDELAKVGVDDLYLDTDERTKILNELIEKKQIVNRKLKLKKKDGNEAVVILNNRLVTNEDGNKYLEGNIHDVTEQTRAEEMRRLAEEALTAEKIKSENLTKEALRLSGTKSKFLANMSHEIRTPMNGILGFLTLIEAGAYENKDELKQFSSSARYSAESLLDVINSVLDLSKIEAGKTEIEEQDFNLIKVIDHSISVITPIAIEKQSTIFREIPDNVETDLRGDQTKIRQILINLLSNAVKFTSNGSIEIKVRTKREEKDDVRLFISVIDTGIGIPADKVTQLFKPFSQVDGSESRQLGGTGLGLVICKEFINLMGGKIGVSSEKGKGSSFNFDIKLKVQSPTTAQDSFKDDAIETKQNKTETALLPRKDEKELTAARGEHHVLLAEDNMINQKVSIKILNRAGYNVTAVSNGAEVLEAIDKYKFDLILMDIQMPEVDGYAATKELRKLKNEYSKIPIIALTAHALMGDREKCIEAGMNDYLTKPIISDKLIVKVDTLLKIDQYKLEPVAEVLQDESVIFDYERLKKVSMNDTEFEKELLTSFLEDINNKLEKMTELVNLKEMAKIMKLAHTIKGASYSVGAQQLGNEAFAIEISCKSDDLESVFDRMNKLRRAYSDTKTEIRNYLG
jgi:PAS domain S-box-containing protein